MDFSPFSGLDLAALRTPVHIIDEIALERNLRVLQRVQDESGARILAALKAFAQFSIFPLMAKYVHGATASSLFEARLAFEEFRADPNKAQDVHATAPAYLPDDFAELLGYVDHVVFNTPAELERFLPFLKSAEGKKSPGLRINPEHRETETALYDPCAPGSRLGTKRSDLELLGPKQQMSLDEMEGLHFHTLCEVGFAPLKRTLAAVEERFRELLERVQWVNFGGGHLITRGDYDVPGLIQLIREFSQRHGVQVYMEPGEAFVIGTGILVSRVLDIVPGQNSLPSAILDVSATAHMPDVLEMPYRPDVVGAGLPGEKAHSYRLGGPTCLAGDVIGDYSFDQALQAGDLIVLLDMSHYTMVKSSNFNGVRSPDIAIANTNEGTVRVVKRFEYEDYRQRLS